MARPTGHQNPQWKGGRTTAEHGYVLIKAPWHPDADSRGYIYEHRLVAEWMLGRRLGAGEVVHHKNHVRSDNRPENLAVYPSLALHQVEHRKRKDRRLPGEDNPTVKCACGCGNDLLRYDGSGRPRRFVQGHNARRAVHIGSVNVSGPEAAGREVIEVIKKALQTNAYELRTTARQATEGRR